MPEAKDLREFYEQNKGFYGEDATLDDVAQDVFTRYGYDKEYEYSDWLDRTGQKKLVDEDLAARKPAEGPEDRSFMGELVSAPLRGTVEAAEMGLRALRTGTDEPGEESGPIDKLAAAGIEGIKEFREDHPILQPKYHGGVKGAITEGVQAVVTSIEAGIPGALAGAAVGSVVPGPGTALGGLVGFATSAGVVFGLAEYDRTIEDADAAGISREESEPAAIRKGLYEGGFEFLSDIIGGKVLGLTKPLAKPAMETIEAGARELFKLGWKKQLQRMAGVAAIETGSELVTAGAQAEEDRRIGLGNARFWEAAGDAFGPAFVASIIFGGIGGTVNHLQRKSLRNSLENPETNVLKRIQAANEVTKTIEEVNVDVAKVWQKYAERAIAAGKPIDLDQELAQSEVDDGAGPPDAADTAIAGALDKFDQAKKARGVEPTPTVDPRQAALEAEWEKHTAAEEAAAAAEEAAAVEDRGRRLSTPEGRQAEIDRIFTEETAEATQQEKVDAEIAHNKKVRERIAKDADKRKRMAHVKKQVDAIRERIGQMAEKEQPPAETDKDFLNKEVDKIRRDIAAALYISGRPDTDWDAIARKAGIEVKKPEDPADPISLRPEYWQKVREAFDLGDEEAQGTIDELQQLDEAVADINDRFGGSAASGTTMPTGPTSTPGGTAPVGDTPGTEAATAVAPAGDQGAAAAPAEVDAKTAVDLWNKSQAFEGEGAWDSGVRRTTANEVVAPLAEQLSEKPWQTAAQLGGNPARILKQMREAGAVDIMWDDEGYPYYALKGTSPAEGLLTEAEADALDQGTAPTEKQIEEPLTAGAPPKKRVDEKFTRTQIKTTLRKLKYATRRDHTGRYIGSPVELDGLYDDLKWKIKDLRDQGDLDPATIEAIKKSGVYDDAYMREVLPEALKGADNETEDTAKDIEESGAAGRAPDAEPAGTDRRQGQRRTEDRGEDRRQEEERRLLDALRKEISDMSPEEMAEVIEILRTQALTDDLTGLGTKKAYLLSEKKALQSSIDVDSLAYINDNFGHKAGDKLLALVGQAFEGNEDAFHVSGDEFVLQGDDQAAIDTAIENAYAFLKENQIELIGPDGTVYDFEVGFSYGTAEDLETADEKLREDKARREREGIRGKRKEKPPSLRKRDQPGSDKDQRGDVPGDKPTDPAEISQLPIVSVSLDIPQKVFNRLSKELKANPDMLKPSGDWQVLTLSDQSEINFVIRELKDGGYALSLEGHREAGKYGIGTVASTMAKGKVTKTIRQAIKELRDREAPEVTTPNIDEEIAATSMEDLEAMFDEVVAEEKKPTEKAPPRPPTTPREPTTRTPTALVTPAPLVSEPAETQETAEDETLSSILKDAANEGVKGVGESLTALYKLLGGSRIKSGPFVIDEDTYQAAKPHLDAAKAHFLAAGKSLKDFFRFIAQHFNNGKALAMRYMRDLKGLGPEETTEKEIETPTGATEAPETTEETTDQEETEETEEETEETIDLKKEAGTSKTGKKRKAKLKDVGEARWKRSAKDGKEKISAIKVQLENGLPEGADAAGVLKGLLQATSRTSLFPVTGPKGATPGVQRFLKFLRGTILPFATYAGKKFGGSPSRYDPSYKEALLGVIESTGDSAYESRRRERLTVYASTYIATIERLADACAFCSTVEQAQERLISMLVILPEDSDLTIREQLDERMSGNYLPKQYRSDAYIDFYNLTSQKRNNIAHFIGRHADSYKEDEHGADKDQPIRRAAVPLEQIDTDGSTDRGDKDLGGQALIDTFGLGSVMFGEWAEGYHRQKSVNLTYDSFKQLAELIGAPDKGISLNADSRLGIAYGVRGRGSFAAATFHPDDKTINLTKTKGDGSLAHEWSHGLDDMTSLSLSNNNNEEYHGYNAIDDLKHALKYTYDLEKARAVANEFLRGLHHRLRRGENRLEAAKKHLREQWDKLTLTETRFYSDAKGIDKGVDGAYWSDSGEMFARAFEAWVADQMQGANLYLINKEFVAPGAVETQFNRSDGAYPTAEERARFNDIYQHFLDGLEWSDEGVPTVKPDYEPVTLKEYNEAKKELENLLDRLTDVYNKMYQGEVSEDGHYWYAYQTTARGEMMQPPGYSAYDDNYQIEVAEGEDAPAGTGAVGYLEPQKAEDVIRFGLVPIKHETSDSTITLEVDDGTGQVRDDGQDSLGQESTEDGQGAQGEGDATDGTGTRPGENPGDDSGIDIPTGGRQPGRGGTGHEAVDSPTEREGDEDTDGGSDALAGTDGIRLDYRDSTLIDQADRPATERFNDNLAAIRLVKTLDAESRLATAEEQEVLAKYSGWGGLTNAVSYSPSGAWAQRQELLKNELTEEEYETVRSTILNAYHTPPAVAAGIWNAIQQLGFAGGRVLDPASGTAMFGRTMPEGVRGVSTLTQIDLDPIAARISAQLQQSANTIPGAFEKTSLPADFYDLAVTNVPFGDERPHDKTYNPLRFPLHDYFINKMLGTVRPGGMVAVITSTGTMDKQSDSARRQWKDSADLIGAIRLPSGTHANAQPAADIIFLRKKGEGLPAVDKQKWVGTKQTEVPEVDSRGEATGDTGSLTLNPYWAAHPEMVLGKIAAKYSWRGNQALVIGDPTTVPDSLAGAIEKLPAGIYTEASQPIEDDILSRLPTAAEVKDGAFYIGDDEKIYINDNGSPVAWEPETPPKGKAAKANLKARRAAVKKFMQLRGDVREILRGQLGRIGDKKLTAMRKRLKSRYDSFVAANGPLHDLPNVRLLSGDPDFHLVLALEEWNSDEQKVTGLAAIFTENTLKDVTPPTRAADAKEGLIHSLSFKARVDIPYISQLTGLGPDQVTAELAGKIYNDPQKGWTTADEYLSGNVREKLAVARQAAEIDSQYAANVAALEAAQPKPLTPLQIRARLGAAWVPPKVVSDFAQAMVRDWYRLRIEHIPAIGRWVQTFHSYESQAQANREKKRAKRSVAATSTWGTSRKNFFDLLDYALNGGLPRVTDPIRDENGKKIGDRYNAEETDAAMAKLTAIKDRFASWVWEDDTRAEQLLKIYNDEYNSHVSREFDGSHLVLPGKVPDEVLQMRPHQLAAVWRYLQTGIAYFGHEVGTGKTYSMIASIMEARRLGLAKKPVLSVLKNTLPSIVSDFYKLYPAANLAVVEIPGDKTKRRKALARVATGNFDAVILTHETLAKIPIEPETERRFLRGEIDTLQAALLAASGGSRQVTRDIENAKKKLEARLQASLENERDDVPTMEELGLDMLVVDEAHKFKNLHYTSSYQNVKGIDQKGSGRAMDLYIKTRHLIEHHGRGVIFSSGTPVSNSVGELFSLSRFLQSPELRRRGLNSFDAWANTFGDIGGESEYAPEGGGYRMVTKFKRFFNIPELMTMVGHVLDIKKAEDLGIERPELEGGKPEVVVVPQSEAVAQYQQVLARRAVRARRDPREAEWEGVRDNLLRIVSDGRNMSIDPRLVDPYTQDLTPEKKIDYVAARVVEKYHETPEGVDYDGKPTKITNPVQLIFADRGTPGRNKPFVVYDALRDELVERGIPKEEIAFIHSYSKKKLPELFRQVRAGKIRVLIGSTEKMGIGVNVQDRISAMHHLDPDWNMANIEQRNGRGWRFANLLKKVWIGYYTTEGTVDAFMWSKVADKARVLGQVMSGDPNVREVEDISRDSMTASEVVAVTANDPMAQEKIELENAVRTMRNEKAVFEQGQRRQRMELAGIPAEIAGNEKAIKIRQRNAKLLSEMTAVKIGDEFYILKKDGKKINDAIAKLARKHGKHLESEFKKDYRYRMKAAQVGTFREETETIEKKDKDGKPVLDKDGKPVTTTRKIKLFEPKLPVINLAWHRNFEGERAIMEINTGAGVTNYEEIDYGTALLITNTRKGIESRAEELEKENEEMRKRIPELETAIAAPFAKQDELLEKEQRLAEVNEALLAQQRENEAALAADMETPQDQGQISVDEDTQYQEYQPSESGMMGVTMDDIKDAFKGQDARFEDGKIKITMQDGNHLLIESVDQITPDGAAFLAAYGRKAEKAAGAYKSGTITIAKIGNKWTLRHEQFHALEDMGYVTARESKILAKRIRQLSKASKFTPANPKDIGGKEDRAKYVTEQLKKRDAAGLAGRVIQKIADLIDGFVALFKKTPRSIIKGIESGKVMKRQGRAAGAGPAQYQAATQLQADTLTMAEKVSALMRKPELTRPGKKDLSYFGDLLASLPDFFKEKIPAVKSMFNATQERQDEFHENLLWMEQHDDVNVGSAFKNLRKQDPRGFAKVGKYLVKRDREMYGYRVKFDEDRNKWVVTTPDGNHTAYIAKREEDAVEKAITLEAQDLQKQNWTPQAIQAVVAFRMSTNKGFTLLTQSIRRIKEAYAKMGAKMPTVPVSGKEVDLDLALSMMGDMRGFYFPRIRRPGRYILTAHKKGENSVLETFNMKRPMNLRRAELEKKGYKVDTGKSKLLGEDVFELSGNLIKTQQIINSALDKVDARLKDASKTDIDNLLADTENIFATAVAEQVANVIRERGSRVHMAKRSEDTYIGYEEDPEIAIAKYIRGLSGGEAKRNMTIKLLRAFTGTEVAFDEYGDIMQYDGDYDSYRDETKSPITKDIFQRINDPAGYEKNQQALEDAQGLLKDNPDDEVLKESVAEKKAWMHKGYRQFVRERMIDQREQPNAFKWGKAYLAEATRNQETPDRVIGAIRGLAVAKYLAFRFVSAPMVNLTALPTSVVASMKAAGIPYKSTWRLLAGGIRDYGRYKADGKFGFDKLKGESAQVFEYIRDKGWDNPQFNSESLSVLRSQLGRTWDRALAFGMFTFSESERLNRAATISAAYRGLKKIHKDKGFDELMDMAKSVSDKSHGIYNKGNYPYLAMGSNPAAQLSRMFYVFKTFSHTYLMNLRRIGFEDKDLVAAAHMVVAPAAIAGIGASVLTPIISQLLAAFGIGDEPEEELYLNIGEAFGPRAEYAARFGLPGLFGRQGISVKGSLALGVTSLPTSISDLLGAPGSVMNDIFIDGIPAIARGDVAKGMEKILPTGFGNTIRAYRESTQGITTRTNSPVFYGNEPLKLDAMETFYRTLSLNPARIAKAREKQWKERKIETKYTKRRTDIYRRIKKLVLDGGSDADWARMFAQVEVYNQDAMAIDLYVPRITRRSIRTNIKRSMTPSKRERRRLAQGE
jgi:N12 class adenine-specific DNA methylase/GGDEF domain-containing protein